MTRFLFSILIVVLFTYSVFSQSNRDRLYILDNSNVEQLSALLEKAETDYARVLNDSSIAKVIIDSQGQQSFLTGVDDHGNLIYSSVDNKEAAITSKVDRIKEGGSTGYDLNGLGVEIGMWEGTRPLLTHQDLEGKIVTKDFAETGSHSTHVAGTLIGTGINANAEGMAPAASLLAYNWSNDESEITSFALNGGILSNHSYSSQNPDGFVPGYGVYTAHAAEWDAILFAAPYLTLVKSAGNHRDDEVNVGDNGYDTVFGTGTSKNLITVGAISAVLDYVGPESIIQSEFSDWGPTDDWRIKPDITANGVSIYSADSDYDHAYSFRNGTSFSAPVVTGTIALLQQFYHNLNGKYMKAATVKSLLICTTDEAGDFDGPDFQSGWGLLNGERAADVIANDSNTSLILEEKLKQDKVFTFDIEVEQGATVDIVLSWTDREGNPLLSDLLDNPTSMLVNDLDVRLNLNDKTYAPWTFVPDLGQPNFNLKPVKGDNFRDNVETINEVDLPEGIYTITVSHKDNLVGIDQDFSLTINGINDSNLTSLNPYTADNLFEVYPVPTSDILTVKLLNNESLVQSSIEILSSNGQLLNQYNNVGQQISIDVSDFNPGVYFISVLSENGNQLKRVVIE